MAVPCCHICLQLIKPDEPVVYSRSLALIFHEKCNYYHPLFIDEQGTYKDVVKRITKEKTVVHP